MSKPLSPDGDEGRHKPSPNADRDFSSDPFRRHIVDLIRRYAPKDEAGNIDPPTLYRTLSNITGRGYSTVKNWMHVGLGMPDLDAMARIAAALQIPPSEIFPQSLSERSNAATSEPTQPELAFAPEIIPLIPASDASRLALQRYAASGASLVLVEQLTSDAAGVIEPGELMLVNSSIDSINGAGIYVLRVAGTTHWSTRLVQPLMSRHAARVTLPSNRLQGESEEIAMSNDQLDGGIAVLGKVVGVLKLL